MSTRRFALVCAWVFGAALAGGCGERPASPGVATAETQAPTSPTAPAATTPPALTDYDKALRYTRCMTENGVPRADPVVGELLLTYGVMSLDMTAEGLVQQKKAYEKCEHHLPDTWPLKVDPKEHAKSARFEKCLRDEGIEVPEPDEKGFIYGSPKVGKLDPKYEAAEAKCRKFYEDKANDLPENQ